MHTTSPDAQGATPTGRAQSRTKDPKPDIPSQRVPLTVPRIRDLLHGRGIRAAIDTTPDGITITVPHPRDCYPALNALPWAEAIPAASDLTVATMEDGTQVTITARITPGQRVTLDPRHDAPRTLKERRGHGFYVDAVHDRTGTATVTDGYSRLSDVHRLVDLVIASTVSGTEVTW